MRSANSFHKSQETSGDPRSAVNLWVKRLNSY